MNIHYKDVQDALFPCMIVMMYFPIVKTSKTKDTLGMIFEESYNRTLILFEKVLELIYRQDNKQMHASCPPSYFNSIRRFQ